VHFSAGIEDISAGIEDSIRHMDILESYVGLSVRMGVFDMGA
jgi:hypothetical protein